MIKMKCFFSYYGSKWRIALKYPHPKYPIVIEPFAGGSGYSVRWYDRDVVLTDLNPRIVGTWDYLIKVTPAEVMRLPVNVLDVRELPDSVCQEARWLIGWNMNHVRTEPGGKRDHWCVIHADSHWGSVVRSRIAWQVRYIKHWKIRLASYESVGNQEATWFVDPPYNDEDSSHYSFSEVNYGRLSRWCRERNGQVIVCEQDGANWLPFRNHVSAKSKFTGFDGGRDRRTQEVIWMKGCD